MTAPISDQAKAAFAAAADWSKQLVTLSTAVVTVTLTFADKVFTHASHSDKWFLWLSWVAFLIAIVAGVMVLGSLTGALASPSTPAATEVNNSAIRTCALAQLGSFVVGVALLVVFGFVAI